MGLEEEYGKNRTSIKICNICFNAIAIFYIVVFGYITSQSFSSADIACTIINALTLCSGYIGVYKHQNVFSIAPPVLVLICSMFESRISYLFFLCVLCTVINIFANKKYRWLEQQDGFPYFNMRFRNQEFDKCQWNIKDPYTVQLEEIKKNNNNSDHMDDI